MVSAGRSDDVSIRFGINTPFFPLSMSFGMLHDPSTRIWFVSLDHWIGYHMLMNPAHQREVLSSPNGYLANRNLQSIIERDGPDRAIDPAWEEQAEPVMLRGLKLKFSQNVAILDMLRSTRQRALLDESRRDDIYWCHALGLGNNHHGRLLEQVREMALNGVPLEFSGE